MNLEHHYEATEEAVRDEISSIQDQIKAGRRYRSAYLMALIGGLIGWKLAETGDAALACALLACVLMLVLRGIELAILHARLEGERTRLAIMRLRTGR